MMEADARLQGRKFTWNFIVTLAVITVHSLLVSAKQSDSKAPPILVIRPLREQIHLVNTTVKLACKVKGKPRPFLNWFKDDVLLNERENGRYTINRFSLVIQNIQMTDAGVFACRAQNQYGESWGNTTIRVVENKLPDISDQYKDQLRGQEGPPVFSQNRDRDYYVARPAKQDIMLECEAHGYPYPTITWLKDGIKIDPEDEDSNYEIDDFKLKINNLVLKDAGNYTCIVENKHGLISWSFAVDVLQRMPLAPMIEGPTNQTVIEGEDARFECKVMISDTTPQLQWLRHYRVNGSYTNEGGEPYVRVLQQSGFHKNIQDPQILVIRNVTHEDAGWYTCLVANTHAINYVSAWLTVINEDSDSKAPPILVNTTVKLACKVKGKPRPFLNWFKDDVLLNERENGRYTINRFSLVIQNIQMTDAGVFACRAQNQYGESWGNTTIRVVENKLPDISDQYKDQLRGQEGPPVFSQNRDRDYYVARPAKQDIMLECEAHGYPYPTITWLKDGIKIDPEDEDSNYEIDDFKLKINNLVLKDAGNYTCIVENKHGLISWSFAVDVLQRMPLAPMIEAPTNQTVIEGEDARFECKVMISDTTPQLQWLRHYRVNGSYTNEGGEPYVRVLQQSGFHKNIQDPQILVIRNVTHEDAGWYTCLVANTHAINYVSAWLTVINEDSDGEIETTSALEPVVGVIGQHHMKEGTQIPKGTVIIIGVTCVALFIIAIILVVFIVHFRCSRNMHYKYRDVKQVIVIQPNDLYDQNGNDAASQ